MPSNGPPKPILTKLVKTPKADEDAPFAKSINNIKNTIAVPSFSKDYPYTKVLNLTLAPNYFNNATTATGSVAERTHPNVNDWYHVNSSSGYLKNTLNAKPIKIAPQSTPGAARMIMFNKDFLKTYQSQLNAKDN